MSVETVIGKPVPRVDGRLKVTGAARYVSDQPAKNVAHAWLVTSRIGRGRVTAMDIAEAERAPGFVALFTSKRPLKLYNAGGSFLEGNITGESFIPLQNDKVLYYGQTIGLVVAETLEEARFAASLVRVKYEEQPVVASWEAAKAGTYVPPQVDFKPPKIARMEPGVADVKAAFDAAEVKVDATYFTPVGHHTPLEPHATMAQWDGDLVTFFNCSQWMTGQQKTLAEVLGIPMERVRVVCPFVGGGFGCKGTIWMPAALVAAAARQIGRTGEDRFDARAVVFVERPSSVHDPDDSAGRFEGRKDPGSAPSGYKLIERGLRVRRARRASHLDQSLRHSKRRGFAKPGAHECRRSNVDARTG